MSEEGNPPGKIYPNWKNIWTSFFSEKFHWVPVSCFREEGKSSRELFEKVRVNAVFVWYFGFWVGLWASKVLSSKNRKNDETLGQWKIYPKSLGSVFSRAGIDAALVKAIFFAGAPTIENRIEQTFQNTRAACAKVAFDTYHRYRFFAWIQRTTSRSQVQTSGAKTNEVCSHCVRGSNSTSFIRSDIRILAPTQNQKALDA